MTHFRRAGAQDLDTIMSIVVKAQKLLSLRKIPQWQGADGPRRAEFQKAIDAGTCYVLTHNDTVVATALLVAATDAAYEQIDGAWSAKSSRPYVAIHRLCVTSEQTNQGFANEMLSQLIARAKHLGYFDVRIDTHRLNVPMQHVIQKAGFHYQGVVHLAVRDGERLGYQFIPS